MTNRNTLISSDNKGYAAYHWERVVNAVDYRAVDPPSLVAAFAQTNAGDMSPNLHQRPGSGPSEDEMENTRLIGLRQYEAAAALVNAASSTQLSGCVDSRLMYVDLRHTEIKPHLALDGKPHWTSGPVGGASAIAGTAEGPGFFGFRQGSNPLWDKLSGFLYAVSPTLRDAQAPKGMVLPGGMLNRFRPFVQEKVPVQLMRIGSLYLVGIPGEVTIVAGLHLRRTVAAIVGADIRDVLVAGYCNAYIHYVTTPHEYAAQRYEGGSTLFGRWELAALQQTVGRLAQAMRAGEPVPLGPTPADAAGRRHRGGRGRRGGRSGLVVDKPPTGRSLGDLLYDVKASYHRGEIVSVGFVGGYPNHDVRRGGSYLEVQRDQGDGEWLTIADDGDWATTFRWARVDGAGSRVSITWATDDAAPGNYRIRYRGTVNDGVRLRELVADSAPFRVASGPGRSD